VETRPSGSSLRESSLFQLCIVRLSRLILALFGTNRRDDDTFFPDFDSLIRMLSSYDSNEDKLIGTLSESTKQVRFSFRSLLLCS
jgi:hypothetical protein